MIYTISIGKYHCTAFTTNTWRCTFWEARSVDALPVIQLLERLGIFPIEIWQTRSHGHFSATNDPRNRNFPQKCSFFAPLDADCYQRNKDLWMAGFVENGFHRADSTLSTGVSSTTQHRQNTQRIIPLQSGCHYPCDDECVGNRSCHMCHVRQ